MINILLLTHYFYPNIGGIESVSEMMADSLHRANYNVKIVTWTNDTGDRNFPYEVIRNPNITTIIRLLRWSDIVVENNPCIRLSWPNLLINRPHITALHTWISRPTGKKSLTDHLKIGYVKKRSRLITTCSNALKQRYDKRAIVVKNPYNDKIFNRNSDIEKDKDFVFLGRLVSDKGAIIAVNAVGKLIHQLNLGNVQNKPTLTIIGDGPERIHLEETVARLDIIEHVRFLGNLNGKTLADELNRHRFLLVPSIWQEPFGIVALEGMACGCVPIVANVGGLPEAVGDAGLVFEGNNVDALLASIESVYMNNELEADLKKHAADHLRSHTQDVAIRQYTKIFDDIVNEL